MHKSLTITYILLVILTIVGALLASATLLKITVVAIVTISVGKFLLVAFQFMELKTAHGFWKGLLIVFTLLIGSIMMLLL